MFGRCRGCARATSSHGAVAKVVGSGAADTELSRGSIGVRVQVRTRPRGEKGTFVKFILKRAIETVWKRFGQPDPGGKNKANFKITSRIFQSIFQSKVK